MPTEYDPLLPKEEATFVVDPAVRALLNQTNRAEGLDNPSLAYNMTATTDYATQLAFLNLMLSARPFWATNSEDAFGGDIRMGYEELIAAGYMDENGWPKEIPEWVESGFVTGWWPETNETMAGTYILEYEGEGEIWLWNVNVIEQSPGRIVFENPEGGVMSMRITDTDPNGTGDYIRNITIVNEDYKDIYDAGAIFYPEFIEAYSQVREIRFLNANNSKWSEWSDHPSGDSLFYAFDSVETEVRFANEVGADVWFTLPLNATDEYIRNFAAYVRDHLDPNLKVTIELSNEVWNWGFEQAHDTMMQAFADWGPDASWIQYYVKKAANMVDIWDDVFGEQGDRLIRALGVQTGYMGLTEQELATPQWFEHNPEEARPVGEIFDVVAITAYFGGTVITDDVMRADLLAAIADPAVDEFQYFYALLSNPAFGDSVPGAIALMQQNITLAQQYGLGAKIYEGGQHVHHLFATNIPQADVDALQDFLSAFVRSEEMADLYALLWDGIETLDLQSGFMQFGAVGSSSIYGSWDLQEFYGDTNPRYEYLMQKNAQTEAWWEDRSGDFFQQGVFLTADNIGQTLIGTNQEDYLIGGAGDDILVGGGGRDGFNGGGGVDTVVLSGTSDDYFIYRDGNGYKMQGPDGLDHLYHIEKFLFEDGQEVLFADLANLSQTNSGPQAVDDVLGVDEDAVLRIISLTANDTDADGNRLGVVGVGHAAHGVVVLNDDGSITYTPHKDYNGSDSFTYIVSDGQATSEATAYITVMPTPDAPVVVPAEQAISVYDQTAQGSIVYTVPVIDPDGDPTFTYTIISGNDAGIFAIDAQTGAISIADAQSLETTVIPYETVTLTVDVSNGLLAASADIVFALYGDNTITATELRGAYYDAGRGHDIYHAAANGQEGIIISTIQSGSETFRAADAPLDKALYAVYINNASALVNGQLIYADYWTLNANTTEYRGAPVSDSPLTTVLALANLVKNAEVMVGTEYGDMFYSREDFAEHFMGMGGDDYMVAEGGDDILDGGTGHDRLYGGSGHDILIGGAGNDTLDGGDGSDTADYNAAGGGIVVNLQIGSASNDGQGGRDTLFAIENVTGSRYNDTIRGDALVNVLIGGDGADYLYGFAGNDTLDGGNGADYVYGGDGDDIIRGGAGNDRLYGDLVNAADQTRGDDTIYGEDGNDVIFGHSGNDTLDGGLGDDYVYGGDGDDIIRGGAGNDRLYGDLADPADQARGDDTIYGGDGNDMIYGHGGNDTLHGGADNDYLYGLDGDDVLLFGEGADSLFGGSGSNTFKAYETQNADSDMGYVQDWNEGTHNRIDLSDLLSGFDSETDNLADFIRIVTGSHTVISVDRDGSGGAAGWDNVLRLTGVSGFETDVQTLVNNGTLVI